MIVLNGAQGLSEALGQAMSQGVTGLQLAGNPLCRGRNGSESESAAKLPAHHSPGRPRTSHAGSADGHGCPGCDADGRQAVGTPHRRQCGAHDPKSAVGAAVAVAVAVTVVGCGGGSPPQVGLTTTIPGTTNSGATEEPNPYLPFPLGATWAYEVTVDGQPVAMHAEVRGASPAPNGRKVAYHVTIAAVGSVPEQKADIIYTVFDDGHVGAPLSAYSALFGTEVKMPSQELVFPRPRDLELRTPVSVVVREVIEVFDQPEEATLSIVARGRGSETVTVPAGRFGTQVLVLEIDLSIPGFGIDQHSTINFFLAKNVGIVKQELRGGVLEADQVLISFECEAKLPLDVSLLGHRPIGQAGDDEVTFPNSLRDLDSPALAGQEVLHVEPGDEIPGHERFIQFSNLLLVLRSMGEKDLHTSRVVGPLNRIGARSVPLGPGPPGPVPQFLRRSERPTPRRRRTSPSTWGPIGGRRVPPWWFDEEAP